MCLTDKIEFASIIDTMLSSFASLCANSKGEACDYVASVFPASESNDFARATTHETVDRRRSAGIQQASSPASMAMLTDDDGTAK